MTMGDENSRRNCAYVESLRLMQYFWMAIGQEKFGLSLDRLIQTFSCFNKNWTTPAQIKVFNAFYENTLEYIGHQSLLS